MVECKPRPGELPEAAAGEVLPRAAQVVITASALAIGALPGPLALWLRARVALVEPGAKKDPLAPALFEIGVDVLSGLVVTDPDGALRVVTKAARWPGSSVPATRLCCSAT